MNIDIRQLRYFVAVAQEQHVGRAAQALNISQPPVTRQIQQLEETLGSKLFIRHAKGVTLTEEGALFLDEARTMLKLLEQAREKIRHARNGELGQLDVAMFGSAVFGKIPQIVLEFRRRYPAVNVALHTMAKPRQLESLQNRSIDLAFNRLIEPRPGLSIEELRREQLFLAVHEKTPLAQMGTVPFREIEAYPLILFPASRAAGFAERVRWMCSRAGIVPNVVQEVGDPVTGLALVASGFGICLVPESMLSVSLSGVRFCQITDYPGDLTVDLSCIYRSTERRPVLNNFLSVAREICSR